MNRKIQELTVLLKANQKRSALLAGLLVVAVVLWIRLAMGGGASTPAPAKAQQRSGGRAQRAADPIDRKPLAQPTELPALAPLTRDLFRLSPAELARSSQTERSSSAGAKSPASPVENPLGARDEKAEREAMERLLREEVARLTLRSVVLGANPVAVIEGAGGGRDKPVVLRPGQMIDGFELIEIRQREVALRKNGMTVTLAIGGR